MSTENLSSSGYYRFNSYWDRDHKDLRYFIEKWNGKKWKFCYGNLSIEEAYKHIKDEELIKSQIRYYRFSLYLILVIIIISIFSIWL